MSDLKVLAAECLREAGFSIGTFESNGQTGLMFEDSTIMGFLFTYSDATALVSSWEGDSKRAIALHAFALRRSERKAWNLYFAFLAGGGAAYPDVIRLATIEENLTGTRKIARAGVNDLTDVKEALLALLPIQSAPQLVAVDIPAEIRLRTTELPPRVVEAFLSSADESVVLQVLEEGP
jgi:hypothetical protein